MDAIEKALSTNATKDIAKAVEAILSGEGDVESAGEIAVKMVLMNYNSEALEMINAKCAIKRTPASERFAHAYLTMVISDTPIIWREESITAQIVRAFPDIADNALRKTHVNKRRPIPPELIRIFFRVLSKDVVCSNRFGIGDLEALFFVALKIKKESWDCWDVYKKHLDSVIAGIDLGYYNSSYATRLLNILPEDAMSYTIEKFMQAKLYEDIMVAKNIPGQVMWQAAQKMSLKRSCDIKLRSRIIIPDKLSGKLLCKIMIRLSNRINSASRGMIVGVPSEEEFKLRTLEVRLTSNDKGVYENAMEARQALENINSYGKKYNDALFDIITPLHSIDGTSDLEYLIGMCRVLNSNALWDALPGLIEHLYSPVDQMPEKKAKNLVEAVMTIKRNAHLMPAAA